jgi:xanthine dehydrogenase large subunit
MRGPDEAARLAVEHVWGTIFQDQPLLAETEVRFVGEGIAIVAATSRKAAQHARSLIEVDYDLLPAILSIPSARAENSWIGFERSIQRGDVVAALENSPHRLKGTVTIHGAEHFYLESQASIAYPREDGQIEVHTSSQHPTETQHVVAHALGIPLKDVTCIVKRMGGGFGGKESQGAPFAAYAALVAHQLKRPARIVLNKDDDMIMTGKRHPFQNEYEVGFNHDGQILGLKTELFSDGGAYADLSTSIMERAMLHIDGAYFIPNLKVTGRVCRTHFHPHTAFRGFGGPQGVATIERIVEAVAQAVGKDPLDVRRQNIYRPGFDTTHYGQIVENNMLPKLFEQIETSSDYRTRRAEIEKHNQKIYSALESGERIKNPTYRGISITPVKFGISFTTRFLNQANALVIVHRDGTLQVSTGATEMGQGANARIAQVIAEELGLARDDVRMMPTSTDKNANTSPTAASTGSSSSAAAISASRRSFSRSSARRTSRSI